MVLALEENQGLFVQLLFNVKIFKKHIVAFKPSLSIKQTLSYNDF